MRWTACGVIIRSPGSRCFWTTWSPRSTPGIRTRILPSAGTALDTSSLSALYTCIYQDRGHSADANLLYTLFSDHRSPAFAEQRRRMTISGQLTDVRLQDALKSQLTNDSWWV